MYNDIVIKRVLFEDLKPLSALKKESVDFHKTPNTTYLGAFIEGNLVGCVGFSIMKNTLRYKTDGVIYRYRNNGIYSELFRRRDEICSKIAVKKITAFCTSKSLYMYLKNGFKIERKLKNSITFVSKTL